MTQGIIWTPGETLVRNSNIKRLMDRYGIPDYRALQRRSVEDIAWFWDAVMKDLEIEWFRPYTKVYDSSQGVPWTRWFLDGKLNIVYNCLDRHARARPEKVAVIWEGEDGASRGLTYGELMREVNRLAAGLRSMGLRKGDRVGLYLPMSPEVVVAMYACLKIGAVCLPVFSGFASSAVATRLNHAEAKVLITSDGTWRRGRLVELKKMADETCEQVPSVENVVVVRRTGTKVSWNSSRDVWFHELPDAGTAPTEEMDSEDYALLLYTSGTTGRPKGTVHTHGGCMAQICKEVAYYFDVKSTDVFFWLTDIGWMMGPWQLIGAHAFGATVVLMEGAPDHPRPDRLWNIIEKHHVTIFGISPTAVRVLRRYGDEWVAKHDLSSLRILGSTGEPWDQESYMWFFERVGRSRLPIINVSGGTEIVGCFLAPVPIMPLKACTLQGPGLGMDVDVWDDEGRPVRGQTGHLVCKQPAPSMTRGFWQDPQGYLDTYWTRWKDVWFHGDWAMADKDDYWFLLGRSDDTLKVSGRRVGPAEVESALMSHPAVSEAAAIGVPDELTGQAVVCFVACKPGSQPSDSLREALKQHVARLLGRALSPKDVKFISELPKTRSAKVVRRVIRAKYLGQELGDLTSIENPGAIEQIGKAL